MTSAEQSLIDAAAMCFRSGFDGVIRIEIDGGGAFYVDGRSDKACVAAASDDVKGDCVWRASADTFERIFEGGRALDAAFMSGRLKISGDMSVMARLKMESAK